MLFNLINLLDKCKALIGIMAFISFWWLAIVITASKLMLKEEGFDKEGFKLTVKTIIYPMIIFVVLLFLICIIPSKNIVLFYLTTYIYDSIFLFTGLISFIELINAANELFDKKWKE